jgi:hypothetical protein
MPTGLVEISFSSVGRAVAYSVKGHRIDPIGEIAFFRGKICSTCYKNINMSVWDINFF